MSDRLIEEALREIRARLRVAEQDIQTLRAAERGLALLTAKDAKSPQILPKMSKSGGITNAIVEALTEMGRATSGEVIIYVRKSLGLHANKNSVRSILSVGRKEGRFVKEGDKYALASRMSTAASVPTTKGGGA